MAQGTEVPSPTFKVREFLLWSPRSEPLLVCVYISYRLIEVLEGPNFLQNFNLP